MPRKRIELGADADAEIATRAARGESAATIHAAIGGAVSLPTVARRVAEVRGKAGSRGPTPVGPPPASAGGDVASFTIETVPETVPEGTSLEQLDRWIRQLETAAALAEKQGNLAALASLAARSATLMALRHRMTPAPARDPNESPDMIALASAGRARLERLLNAMVPAAD